LTTKQIFAGTKDFRKQYFGDNADKFIVGCVNRNQSRKDIPTTIFGFMEYWESHNKNALLYLHMDPKDPMGWDLKTILKQTPLKEGIDYMISKNLDVVKETTRLESYARQNRGLQGFDYVIPRENLAPTPKGGTGYNLQDLQEEAKKRKLAI
jgi:hypothetical protein